jgi:hypothetical protein
MLRPLYLSLSQSVLSPLAEQHICASKDLCARYLRLLDADVDALSHAGASALRAVPAVSHRYADVDSRVGPSPEALHVVQDMPAAESTRQSERPCQVDEHSQQCVVSSRTSLVAGGGRARGRVGQTSGRHGRIPAPVPEMTRSALVADASPAVNAVNNGQSSTSFVLREGRNSQRKIEQELHKPLQRRANALHLSLNRG